MKWSEKRYYSGKIAEAIANSKDIFDAVYKAIESIPKIYGINDDTVEKIKKNTLYIGVKWKEGQLSDIYPQSQLKFFERKKISKDQLKEVNHSVLRLLSESNGEHPKFNENSIYYAELIYDQSQYNIDFSTEELVACEKKRLFFFKVFKAIVSGTGIDSEDIFKLTDDYAEMLRPELVFEDDHFKLESDRLNSFKECILALGGKKIHDAHIFEFLLIAELALIDFLSNTDYKKKVIVCKNCSKFHVLKSKNKAKFCSNECRMKFNNQKRIQSGAAKDYKRRKREEGAKESYYG